MGLLIDSNCLQVLRLEPYMGEDVPVRWFNFERVVEALVQQKIFYLKISQLYFIVSKTCLIEDEAEMVAMLDFYHDLGIIIWHGDTVVLQTQWLIHLFRKLITIRPFDEQVYCWSFRKDSILLFDTVKPFLLDTRAGEATSSCPGFLIEPRGTNERERLASVRRVGRERELGRSWGQKARNSSSPEPLSSVERWFDLGPFKFGVVKLPSF